MALLTPEEKAALVKLGHYGIREKCDLCHEPILSALTYTKKDQVWCESCYTLSKGRTRTLAKIQEEDEMAKTTKKQASGSDGKKEVKESKKIGGFLPNGSSIGDLYLLLEDEKKHTFKEGDVVVKKHKKDLMGRLGNLYRSGIRNKAWSLIVDKEAQTIQMKLGKPSGDAMVVKKEKEEKKTEKKAEAKKAPAKEEKKATVPEDAGKSLKTVAALVRRTLKSGKDWTKNKLAGHLYDEHDISQRITEAAIAAEIKAGGIKIEDGVLELV